MGYQDLSMVQKILKIIKILMRTRYLIFMLLKIILMTKVMNLFLEGGDMWNNDPPSLVHVKIP